MGRLSDMWTPGPLGVPPDTARRLQALLEPGEELRFVFQAETKRNPLTLVLEVLARFTLDTLGTVYVVITDRALLLVDMSEQLLDRDRRLYADLPLPSTLRPSTGSCWITVDGKRVYVPGGRQVIERAEAALKGGR